MTETEISGFIDCCQVHQISCPVKEHKFHPERKWRFDFSWPYYKVALEVEGGVFGKNKSRHFTGNGILGDMEKYNSAAIMGWKVLRISTGQLYKSETFTMIKQALQII